MQEFKFQMEDTSNLKMQVSFRTKLLGFGEMNPITFPTVNAYGQVSEICEPKQRISKKAEK